MYSKYKILYIGIKIESHLNPWQSSWHLECATRWIMYIYKSYEYMLIKCK